MRGLSILRNEFKETLSNAIQFETKLAEIQTIAPTETIDALGEEVRKLSNEFNIPILDVAKAKYDSLSQGFTKTTDQVNILTAAFQLSKTSISTGTEAANLLAGTLNAFGESSDKAADFAAKFFAAVRAGHLIGSDLAANLAKVAPTAKTLGVSLDELLAQFVTLSIEGVKPANAATEINAALTALIKPSEAAADAIKGLGFKGATDLISGSGGMRRRTQCVD